MIGNNDVVFVIVNHGELEGVYSENRATEVAKFAAQLIRGASDQGQITVATRPVNADSHTDQSRAAKRHIWRLIENELAS
jgi:hypothetical protein